jgi:hypothetical protein
MTQTFQVSVGEQCKIFTMHTLIAIRQSPFFKAALSHDWQEAREKKVSLPDCEPAIFECYSQWVYTAEISFSSEPRNQPLELIKLWVLGDFLGNTMFCACVSHALATHEKVTGPESIKHLYDHISHDSHLRWSVVNIWATRYNVAYISELFATKRAYPKDFVVDLFKFLAQYGRIIDNVGWVPPPHLAPAAEAVVVSDDEV